MYFATFGVPQNIKSDGGPPFDSSDYTQFLRRWKIKRRLSLAYYPQSNGRAEVGVKTANIYLQNLKTISLSLSFLACEFEKFQPLHT